ncbi:hypothetical protein Ga0466249_005322 [Sporomusaceae bacterium BoRhaA]|jgi:hypothetical protein|uniref:gas vesicle protein GvpG n=1 Tax=Pelorhabdus rhamnosifermentans TaxID=2772457 RepID=UPI001C062299|nr:gas vesicle protein GvpG [Pelorhabdus rhamnosifermentans]MBU2704168.1 hypothetical protein [Pelorhabdus rhamnosifermentans]
MLAALLLLPLVVPIKGVAALAEKIVEQSDAEYRDKTKISMELVELQIQLDLDQISEAEYNERELELMKKLAVIEALQREEEEEEEGG